MVGHITVTAVDDEPASMSRTWVADILRDMMGFAGVVVTDGLGMGALTNDNGNAEIAVGCVKAGCDVLLLPQDPYEAVNVVVAATEAGDIPEAEIDAHVSRILQMKARHGHGIWDWKATSDPYASNGATDANSNISENSYTMLESEPTSWTRSRDLS